MTDIATRIEDSGAIKRGTFQLSDDEVTDFYIDKYVFETRPALLADVRDSVVGEIDCEATDVVTGPALGAVPLVTAISLATGIDSVFVRKGTGLKGTQARIEGAVDKGTKAVIVEDVTMTGWTAIESARVLEGMGAIVDAIVAVIDRSEGAADRIREAGYEFNPVLKIDENFSIA